MRIIVVGVGGAGAMAAWRLAKVGHDVLAFERFSLDHDRGSSYGDSRIVRRVYPDPFYSTLMNKAYALWREFQAHFPERELFAPVGGVYFGAANSPLVQEAAEALEAAGAVYQILDAGEHNERFPGPVLKPGEMSVFESEMGYARASRCVCAAVELARGYGAQIREETVVTGIEAVSDGIRVSTTTGERVEGDRLIVTAGAWTKHLLETLGVDIPLTVTRQPYVHLGPAGSLGAQVPVWIDAGANTYGFPELGDVPGLKVGQHDHGRAVTPETVEREVTQQDREGALRYASERFPWLGDNVTYAKVCLYTNTPDEDFVVDAIPGLPGGFVLSACSGHGFKFTPLVGEIAAQLAGDETPFCDLSRFRLSRFTGEGATP